MFNPFRRRAAVTESVAAEPLAAQAIHRNLLLAPDGVWAWFRMDSTAWAFRSSGDRAAILDAATIRWADLAGHRVHLRRTAHPVPYYVWAQNLDRATPNPLSVPEGAPTWADYLESTQDRIALTRMESPTSYIGVRISTAHVRPHELACIVKPCANDTHPEKITKAHLALTRIATTVSKEGFNAQPVSARLLGWLIHASVGLGMPVSVSSLAGPALDFAADDMAAFTEPVHVSAGPLSKTLTVRALRDGAEFTRHLSVLSVGRMSDRDTESPAYDPWMVHSDRLPFPVEWSAVFDVIPPAVAAEKARFIRQRADSVQEHYQEHGERPPRAVGRSIEDAVRIEDETTDGDKEIAVRLAGPIRCAVTGATEPETLDRVATLVDAYAMNQRIALHLTYGQYPMWREFIPGESSAYVGFQRVMPAYYAATAVPNAATKLGDGEGPYLGRSGHRATFLDPTWGPRHNRSGMVVIAGGLGSGKSTLGGAIVEPAVRRGHRTVIFDPSGPLARLVDMPALNAHARHVELSGAEPGTLNPYWLIPEPKRKEYRDDRAWQAARREANIERRDLMVDALVMLLPDKGPGAVAAIEHAVNEVGGTYATNPWRVVRALEGGDAHARSLGAQLRAVTELRGARLIFPEDEHAADAHGDGLSDARLTVITMRGIITPPTGTPKSDWTRQERMAVPVLHMAARYAMRAMYADTEPKVILCDELGIIAAGGSTFRSFVTRGARDSRKTNTMFGILSQNPADLIEIAPQITNLIGAAFIGRLNDEESARAALPLLGVPEGHGYEKALLRLSSQEPGEFLMRDWNGLVDKVKVDLGHRPDLLETLNTTPVQRTKDGDRDASWTDELGAA